MRAVGTSMALAVLGGCATPLSALTSSARVELSGLTVVIRHTPESQTDDVPRIERALQLGAPRVAKWGAPPKSVDLFVLPTHDDLEVAARRPDHGWLRAWAQFDRVLFQAPSTWAKQDHELIELLAHELTHCTMYQRSANANDWVKKRIPLWFREGMATWTAEQGYRWLTLEELAHVFETAAHGDPLDDAEAMYRTASGAVYAASHHAFTFLVRRYGTAGVEQIMAEMSKGSTFDRAFADATGIPTGHFVAEFRRYVKWRGFRGNGRPVAAP